MEAARRIPAPPAPLPKTAICTYIAVTRASPDSEAVRDVL